MRGIGCCSCSTKLARHNDAYWDSAEQLAGMLSIDRSTWLRVYAARWADFKEVLFGFFYLVSDFTHGLHLSSIDEPVISY